MADYQKNVYEEMKCALEKAKKELSHATYMMESSDNPGLRKINSNKADWLKWIIYLAEIGLEHELEVKRRNEPNMREELNYIDEIMQRTKMYWHGERTLAVYPFEFFKNLYFL